MRSVCAGAEYDLVPLAHETYGRLGAGAMGLVSELGDVAASSGRTSKARFVRSALAELSCALCRLNSSVFGQYEMEAARAAGRAFMPGCAAPVGDMGAL